MADNKTLAREHITEADRIRTHLDDVYRVPSYDRDARLVARLNTDLGEALKLAELHSLLAISDSIDDLLRRL